MGQGRRDHVVRFYDGDEELLAQLSGLVVEALTRAEPMICVATPAHREALEALLVARGLDVSAAATSGAYRAYDAGETLALFMVEGRPDGRLFQASVGAIVDDAASGGAHVQVYGEMVALLWERGETAAALELEELWNALSADRDFTLLCAYPTTALETAPLGETSRVCALHTEVVPPDSYQARVPAPPLMTDSVVLVPVPQAVPAARRFVAHALSCDAEPDVLADAELLVSELATNADRHATSAFRLSVRRSGATVRVAVQDGDLAFPEERHPSPDSGGGRGVGIVGKVASRWGYDRVDDGKVVWAELVDEP